MPLKHFLMSAICFMKLLREQSIFLELHLGLGTELVRAQYLISSAIMNARIIYMLHSEKPDLAICFGQSDQCAALLFVVKTV